MPSCTGNPNHGRAASRDALGTVHEDADRGQEVGEVHLPTGEDGSRRDRELVMARFALELAARGYVIGFQAAATRTNRLTVRLIPADRTKRLIGCVLATLVDVLEGQGAGLCRKKEMLSHNVLSPLRL